VLTLGGGNLVEYFSITNTAGSAILGNAAGSGTSTIKGITVTDAANAGNGVTISANVGTLNFSDLIVTTSTGNAFAATGGGTINVTTGSNFNALTSTTGTALNVTNTTIGASGMTFRSINAGTAVSGPTNGIVLNNTGASGGLTVSGNGSAGSGGTIQKGATGISLTSTNSVSLNWMQLNDFTAHAILGATVNNFIFDHSVVSGTSGNSGIEAAIEMTELTGSASMSNDNISGGYDDNVRVANSTGTLNRLTVSSTTIGANDAVGGNTALNLQVVSGNPTFNVTVTGSTFTASRSHFVQFLLNGTGTSNADFQFTNNTITQAMTSISGAGGVFVSAATNAAANLTYNIQGNTIHSGTQTITGSDINVAHFGTGTYIGTIDSNIIGTSGVSNSGSAQGDGIIAEHYGDGTSTVHITNNTVRRYNNIGIEFDAGDEIATPGTVNLTLTGNTVAEPEAANALHGVYLDLGLQSTPVNDAMTICASVGGAGGLSNSITGSGVAANGGLDMRAFERFHVTTQLPGYGGANNSNASVVTYLSGRNSAGAAISVTNNVSAGGGGYVNAVSCP
jgi:hypothetical protein